MKDIFANLYNKVFSFFHQTEESEDTSAKDVACNRLKLVLMQDRTNLSPAIMDRMKRELIDLLSKYVELDKELLDLNFEQEDNQMALMLSIPVIRAKDEHEIEELLKVEDENIEETDGETTDATEEEAEEEIDNAEEENTESNSATNEDNTEESGDETEKIEAETDKAETSDTEEEENPEISDDKEVKDSENTESKDETKSKKKSSKVKAGKEKE